MNQLVIDTVTRKVAEVIAGIERRVAALEKSTPSSTLPPAAKTTPGPPPAPLQHRAPVEGLRWTASRETEVQRPRTLRRTAHRW